MQEFLSVIRSSTLFSGISEQELTAMLACLGTKASRFPKDALLLRAGDTAEPIGSRRMMDRNCSLSTDACPSSAKIQPAK